MKAFKKTISILLITALIVGAFAVGTISPAASGTGVGLADWVMNAYNEGWSYVWGGASVGAVDCSGLIVTYCGGNRTSMLADAQENGRDWGYISDGIPNVHGLGLSRPGHVGVYVGNGMEVDARGSDYGVCYQAVGDRWECWFKLTAVKYPTKGWQQFNGDWYYYENGEYITDTTRTIDGDTYYFASSGISTKTASAVTSTAKSSSGSSAKAAKAEDTAPLKKGSQGARVEKMQERLQILGYYNGLVDGDFGALTEKAFMLFQKQAGLYVDGIAGNDLDLLYSDDAPYYVPEAETATEAVLEKKAFELAETGFKNDPVEVEEAAAPADTAETAENNVLFTYGDYADDIVPVQERLIELGYLEGAADGGYGKLTQAAVLAFRKANQLNETGDLDEEAYSVLFSDAAVRNTETAAVSAQSLDTAAQEAQAQAAQTAVRTAATTASDTTVERSNAAISQRAISGITDSIAAARTTTSTNFQFIMWLAVMIVVMLISFAIVYSVEKKKAIAMAAAGRRFM